MSPKYDVKPEQKSENSSGVSIRPTKPSTDLKEDEVKAEIGDQDLEEDQFQDAHETSTGATSSARYPSIIWSLQRNVELMLR